MSQKKNKLIIFGTKNMSVEIKEMAEKFYAKTFAATELVFFEKGISARLAKQFKSLNLYYIVGFGGSNRQACLAELKAQNHIQPFTLIHPAAVISPSAKIGLGCLVMANATVSTNAVIGDHSVINYNASVGHDSVLMGNNFIQPGARVSGNCRIGEASLIGSNAFVYQNITIGSDCLVDALTYVREDLANGMLMSSRYKKAIKRSALKKGKLPMWQ